MALIRVTKVFTFEMAHALPGHDGPCRNIHGHSYSLYVTVCGTPEHDDTSPKNGMVIDFSILKKIVDQHIVKKYDHALVLREGYHPALPPTLASNVIFVAYQPTCENLIADFVHSLQQKLPERIRLHSLRLQETKNSFAEWFADDNE